MRKLQICEPQFYQFWRAHQTPGDPQLDRWIEYEGDQPALARDRVAEISKKFRVARHRVLDLGCQWGATTIALAQADADPVGIDIDSILIEGARLRAREQGIDAEFVEGRAEELPFAAGSFDAVICANVIEHVASHRKMVREVARVLKAGGHLFIDGPNRFAPAWFRSDPHYHMRGISLLPPALGRFYVVRLRGYPSYDVGRFPIASRLARLLERNGLEVTESSRPAGLRGLVHFNTMPQFYIVAFASGAFR